MENRRSTVIAKLLYKKIAVANWDCYDTTSLYKLAKDASKLILVQFNSILTEYSK